MTLIVVGRKDKFDDNSTVMLFPVRNLAEQMHYYYIILKIRNKHQLRQRKSQITMKLKQSCALDLILMVSYFHLVRLMKFIFS